MKTPQIEIKDIIRSKYKGWIPKSLISFLRRLIHQQEINEMLQLQDHIGGVEYANRLLKAFDISLNISGEEQITALKGRQLLFVSNHPLGGLDGIALTAWLGKLLEGRLFVPVNDLLMSIPQFGDIFFPVNKHGVQNRKLGEMMVQALEEKRHGLTFPAGFCSRQNDKGEIRDTEWKSSFLRLAQQHNLTIVPLFFDAANSPRFYRYARWRQGLGIKLNIEMVLLPDEMFKGRHKTFNIYVAPPIFPEQIPSEKSKHQAFSDQIKESIYRLPSISK